MLQVCICLHIERSHFHSENLYRNVFIQEKKKTKNRITDRKIKKKQKNRKGKRERKRKKEKGKKREKE